MTQNTMNIVKSIGAGMLAGMAVGYVGSKMTSMSSQNTKTLKKDASKALNAVSDVASDVSEIMMK